MDGRILSMDQMEKMMNDFFIRRCHPRIKSYSKDDGWRTWTQPKYWKIWKEFFWSWGDFDCLNSTKLNFLALITKKESRNEDLIDESEQQVFVNKMMKDFDSADLDGNGSMDFSEYIRKGIIFLDQEIRQFWQNFRIMICSKQIESLVTMGVIRKLRLSTDS